MNKVKFFCDSGANIHSCREEVVDLVEEWGFEEGEWEKMSDDEKQKEAIQWAWESGLEIGFQELGES